jgi:hypothetical protein
MTGGAHRIRAVRSARLAANEEKLMDALDGNAIAGELYELFGSEMTTATGACAHCGTFAQIAELSLYTQAPGKVARCPTCEGVVFVLLNIRETRSIDLHGFHLPDALSARPIPDRRQPTP